MNPFLVSGLRGLVALPLSTLAATETFYIHVDHLDTPRLITDGNQDIRWRWDNDDPFGGNIANANPSGLGAFEFNLRFPGQYFDKETNQHYNYFRDYSPEIGRYIQSDPIGLGGGLNTFAYALNNPLRFADPTGENPLAGVAAVGAAAIRICNRIPKCKAKLAELMKKAAELCKSVECTVRFDKKGHPFPTPTGGKELCMHWQIDCHIKGQKGSGFSVHSRLPICWEPGDSFPSPPPPRLP